MMDEYIPKDLASFNQAQLQTFRLNELLQRIDRLNTNLLMFNPEMELYNYQVVINDLNSILTSISPKLDTIELKEAERIKKILEIWDIYFPIWNIIIHHGYGTKKEKVIVTKNFNGLKELLFNYKILIEKLMDLHEFGNPSKADPRRAIVED